MEWVSTILHHTDFLLQPLYFFYYAHFCFLITLVFHAVGITSIGIPVPGVTTAITSDTSVLYYQLSVTNGFIGAIGAGGANVVSVSTCGTGVSPIGTDFAGVCSSIGNPLA